MGQSVWAEPDYVTTSRFAAEFYAFEYLSLERQLDEAGRRFDLKPLGDLGKLFTGPFGSKLPTSTFVEQGVPLLRVQNVGELEVLIDNLANIGWDTHQEIIRSKLHSGDLAIAKAGRIGTTAIIPTWMPECNVTQHIVGVRVNHSKVDNYYLAAFLVSEYGKFQFERQGVGTLLKYLGIQDTRQSMVVLPPRPVQEYIGAKVRLAERCRARVRDLRMSTTSALRKALGKVPEIHTGKSTTWVNPQNVFDRIDSDYFNRRYLTLESQVEDLTGRSLALGQVCDVFSGTSAPDQEAETTRRVVKVGGLSEDGIDWDNTSYLRADRKVKPRFVLRDGDVMFCCAAHHHSYIGKKVTLVLVGSIKAIPTPEVMVCRSQDDHLLPGYLAEFLRSPWGYWQIQRTVKGITAHTYSNDVKRIVIPVIPPEIQEQIDRALREANQLIVKSRALVREAKADVEALIEGRLDVEGIVAGRVQPPAWEDVEV